MLPISQLDFVSQRKKFAYTSDIHFRFPLSCPGYAGSLGSVLARSLVHHRICVYLDKDTGLSPVLCR